MYLSKSQCSAPLPYKLNPWTLQMVTTGQALISHILIRFKIKFEKTKPNVSKFYPWLQINGDAPFVFEMRVVYSCMFESIIYSCESWGDVGHISDSLIAIELKALKYCMEVKQSTLSNLIYTELNQHCVSNQRQAEQFHEKISLAKRK